MSRRNQLVLASGAILAGAGYVGCATWGDFENLGTSASVTRVHVEGEGGPNFGQVLVGYTVPVQRDFFVRGTRLFVGGYSSGSEIRATYAVFRVWDEVRPDDGDRVRTDLEIDRGTGGSDTVPPAFRGCHQDDRDMGSTIVNCGSGRRAGAGFPYMHNSVAPDWWGCVAVTSGEVGMSERLQIRCESIGGQTSLLLPVENDLGWGASAAGVPVDHPFGVAVFGAPDADGQGGLFRLKHLRDQQTGLGMGQPDGGSRRALIPITGLDLEPDARLGRSVALTMHEGNVRIAAGFGASRRTVVVADVTSADGTSVTAEVVACLSGADDDVAFGDTLAFGDFDGDGTDDLAVGSQPTETGGAVLDRPVVVFDGSAFGSTATCTETMRSSSAPAASFGCASRTHDGLIVACETSRFGYAIAAGDLNGDGRTDLVVGAPGANASGPVGAGVVQTISGTDTLSMMGQDEMLRGTLRLTSSVASSSFGSAVATIPAPLGRADIAVSQASPQATHIFYCSDVPGDTPSTVMTAMTAEAVRSCGLRRPGQHMTDLEPGLVPRP